MAIFHALKNRPWIQFEHRVYHVDRVQSAAAAREFSPYCIMDGATLVRVYKYH